MEQSGNMGQHLSSEAVKRLHRCCFTGHRPEKLKIGEKTARALIRQGIQRAYAAGYTTFISGMARGIDLWAADIVLEERRHHPDMYLICAVPHPDFEKRWNAAAQQLYSTILQQADLTRIICPSFSMGAYQKRNIWMVDHSSLVLAYYNGGAGGTANTIAYAKSQGVRVRLLNEEQ